VTPQQFIDAALWFPEAVETEPFGPGTLVYKVAGRMFALLSERNREGVPFVTLKCAPDLALELRAEFDAVFPGYHTDKRHWNSVLLDGTVPDDELLEMLRHSYQQVVARLRRADRERLLAALGEDAPPLP